MKRYISKLAICLLLLTAPLAVEAYKGDEHDRVPLPEQVFKALEAGQPQVVIVYGTSVSIWGQWAKEMETYFNELYPGQVTFINSAKAGMHSNWGAENLKERVLDYHPDLVFIEFAINDAAVKHGISIKDCQDNLDTMVKALQKQNPQVDVVLQTMNPAWDSPKSAPKKYASDRPNLEVYYKVYRSYALIHGLPLVDNYPIWKKIMVEEPERYQQMVADGLHPDSNSSKEVAWPKVKELLDRARAFAGGDETVDVWPEGLIPGIHTDQPERLKSPERTDAIRITNVSKPTLTLFSVEGQDKPAPTMVVCPGGGYDYCVVDKEGTEIAKWLNSLGINALVLKYRVPRNRDGALQDIQRSIRLARANAQEWNIDPKRLGAIGFSAGGNLCAKASNLFETQTYLPVDEMDRQSCRPDFVVLVYPAYLEREGRIAEDLNLEADIPATLIVHSEDDETFVLGSEIYAAALEEHKHPCRFLLYTTGGHGYGLRSEHEARLWPKETEQWLRENGFLTND